jgi:hypothetical protein
MTLGDGDAAILHLNVILNEVKNLFTLSTQVSPHRCATRQEILRKLRMT